MLTNKTYDNELRGFYKKVLFLVIPLALQNLINVGITATDVIILGKVSETALSACSLAGQTGFIMTLIFFGLTSGAAVLTSQYWGKKDYRSIEKIFGITFRVGIFVSLTFTILALSFPQQLLHIYTNDPSVIKEGVKYLRIIAFSYFFSSMTMVYLNIMRSVERVLISTIVYLCSLMINVFFNVILVFGLLGFPALGIRGSATATLIARICEFLIILFYEARVKHEIHPKIKDIFKMDKILFKDFLVISLPVLINELLWGAGTSANTAIIGHLGSAAVAANSVAQVSRQLAMVVTFGIATATAIIMGKAIGEGKEELAKVYSKRFVILSILVGAVGGGLILLSRPMLIDFLSLSSQAKHYLSFMLFVMTYFSLCQSYNATLIVGVFRSGGDTKYSLYMDVGVMWFGSILLGAVAAFIFHCNVFVVYVLLMSDEVIKLIFTTTRFQSYKWLKNVTRDF